MKVVIIYTIIVEICVLIAILKKKISFIWLFPAPLAIIVAQYFLTSLTSYNYLFRYFVEEAFILSIAGALTLPVALVIIFIIDFANKELYLFGIIIGIITIEIIIIEKALKAIKKGKNLAPNSANEIKFSYARPAKRLVAWFIDGALLLAIFFIVNLIGRIFINSTGIILIHSLITAALIESIIALLYYALMESSSRQATIGKMAMKIKVADLEGRSISFWRAAARSFAKILSVITYIGLLNIFFHQKRQCLHDLIAKTIVIDREYLKHLDKAIIITIPNKK